MSFKCDGKCPGNEFGDCYGEAFHLNLEIAKLKERLADRDARIKDIKAALAEEYDCNDWARMNRATNLRLKKWKMKE